MKILPILRYRINSTNPTENHKFCKYNLPLISLQNQPDTVSFGASKSSGEPLRKLAEYGMPDMYTGQKMLSKGAFTRLLKNHVFELPLNKLVSVLSKYEETMLKTEHEFFEIIKQYERKNPNATVNDVLKQSFEEHQDKLLAVQRPIFAELMDKACDMPRKHYDEFMEFMKDTNKRIAKDFTTSHFSEKEFIYKLQKVEKQINSKNNHKENFAIREIIKEAKKLFSEQINAKRKFGRGPEAKKLKMEYQLLPNVLKQNLSRFQHLQIMFDHSIIKNNRDVKKIFDNTRAKICGFPIIEPFKRQEFIYDLKNLLKYLKDKDFEAEMVEIAHKLPTSVDNVSAFIVKHIDATPDKIGFYMLKDSVCSIEHIEPKTPRQETKYKIRNKKKKKVGNNVAGKNHINNYGLCSVYINSKRTNIPFDEWIRQNPQVHKNCQKYVNRLITLYNNGTFKKVGLNRSYILNFVERINKMSPQDKPIILDISALKK